MSGWSFGIANLFKLYDLLNILRVSSLDRALGIYLRCLKNKIIASHVKNNIESVRHCNVVFVGRQWTGYNCRVQKILILFIKNKTMFMIFCEKAINMKCLEFVAFIRK